MKKILVSVMVLSLVMMGAVLGTRAYFSDTETSENNTFLAGAIDLTIDNDSYFNGAYNMDTSWTRRDLTVENFFNFLDLKPGDWGEDTISFYVNDNPSWLCMDVELTSIGENGQTEPEREVDPTPDVGELQDELYFVFWVDDGDNVLEEDEVESIFWRNATLGEMSRGPITLADSSRNVWTGEPGDPFREEVEHYIAKAWCYGGLTLDPALPGNENSPTIDPGVLCDGEPVTNASQTDGLTADVTFYAVQARHNENFLCSQWVPLAE